MKPDAKTLQKRLKSINKTLLKMARDQSRITEIWRKQKIYEKPNPVESSDNE